MEKEYSGKFFDEPAWRRKKGMDDDYSLESLLLGVGDPVRNYDAKIKKTIFDVDTLKQMDKELRGRITPTAITMPSPKTVFSIKLDENGVPMLRDDWRYLLVDPADTSKIIEYKTYEDLFDEKYIKKQGWLAKKLELLMENKKDENEDSIQWFIAPSWYSKAKEYLVWLAHHIDKAEEIPDFFRFKLKYDILDYANKAKFRWGHFDGGLMGLLDWENISIWKVFQTVSPDFNYYMNHKEALEELLWVSFKQTKRGEKVWREFAERAIAMAGGRIGTNYTVLDALTKDQLDYVVKRYMKDRKKEFKWTPSVTQTLAIFSKMKFSDQMNIVNKYLTDFTWPIDYLPTYLKVVVWGNWLGKLSYHWSKILRPQYYSMLMSASWTSPLMSLLAVNSAMYVTDTLQSAGLKNLKWDFSSIIHKHGLELIKVKDAATLNPDSMTMWDGLYRLGDKAIDLTKAGWFNGADPFFADSFYAKKYSHFFQTYFPHVSSFEEVDDILTTLRITDPEQYDHITSRANSYVEAAVRADSTNSDWAGKLSRVYYTDSIFTQAGKEILMRTWDFMTWWGRNKIKWAIKHFKNLWNALNTDIGWKYLDSLQWGNALDSKELLSSLILNNRDAIDFITKLQVATKMWILIHRYWDYENDNDNSLFDEVQDVFDIFRKFNGEMNAIETLPEWKMFSSFLDATINDYDWDGQIEFHPVLWAQIAWTQAAKSFLRWFWLWSGLVWGIATTAKTGENPIKSIATWVIENAQAFSHYTKEYYEKAGSSDIIKRTPNDFILWLLGDKGREYDLLDKTKKKLAYARILDDPMAIFNYFNLRVPFFRHIAFAWAPSYNKMDEAIHQWTLSDGFNLIADKRWDELTQDQLAFVYNQMDKVGGNKVNTRGDFYVSHSFKPEDWESRIRWQPSQVRENVIHQLMKEKIAPSALAKLEEGLTSKNKTHQINASKALAYIQAKSPGSAAVVLQYMMNSEYFHAMISTYGRDQKKRETIPDDWSNKVKAQIAKKFMPFIDQAERYSVMPQLALKIAKDSWTPISQYISGGDTLASSLSIKLPTAEFPNSEYYQRFKTSVLINSAASEGDINAYRFSNQLTNIFKHSLNDKDWSTWVPNSKWTKRTLQHMSMLMDEVNDLRMWDGERTALKTGILLSADKYIDSMVSSKSFSKKHAPEIQNLLNHLWTTTKELNDDLVEDAEEKALNDLYHTWYSSRWKKKKDYQEDWELLKRLKKMVNNFWKYKDFSYKPPKPDYTKNRYYKKDEVDVLLLKGRSRWETGFWNLDTWGKNRYAKKQEAPGWATYQRQWWARPKWAKTEDPDKPIDFISGGRVKRLRKSSAKVKNLAQAWRRVNKLWRVSSGTPHRRQRARKTKRSSSK